MNIHVCLVSAQAAANLLPTLDPALKPQKTILVVSAKMREQAESLTQVFRESAVQVEPFQLSDEHDFQKTKNELVELATRLEGHDVQLNLTGGTKLMAVAAQAVAELSGWRMFYVDADTDHVIWLDTDAPPPQPLQQHLKLRHYLRSYGFELASKPNRSQASAAQQRLTQTLVQCVGSLENALSALNALAQDAENRRSLGVALHDWQRHHSDFNVLLRHFEDAQALTLQGQHIQFASETARDFVKGGWLELHTMQTLHQLTGPLGIRDKAVNLEVIDRNGTKNELDIAFMARNRLFVIECKTARIDKPQGTGERTAPPKANDTLFKLAENCRRIGGLGTRGMLVSYRKLRDPELRLARALGTRVVAGADIARLSQALTQWVQPA